jgi:predicted phosphodiesterase
MRFAIFGDIHSNLEALHAVLRDAEAHHCTNYICLGDIVGYNASPKECLDIVRAMDCPVVKGNHDELACLDINPSNVSPLANEGIDFTRRHLTEADLAWLSALKFVRQVRDFTIVHATLDTPHKWGYVLNQLDAAASFSYQHTQLCFFGHTHVPRAYIRDHHVRTLDGWQSVILEAGRKYFLNVGSVGQPRDGDPRASYAIFYVEEHYVELRRVDYDIAGAQRKIIDSGLPPRLATRLGEGR